MKELFMKKRLSLLFILILLLTGCSQSSENTLDEAKEKQFACLINELENYITIDGENITDIPLAEITREEKIPKYFKARQTSSDNMFIVVDLSDYKGKDFQLYFSNKYSTYQYSLLYGNFYVYIKTPLNDVDFNEISNKCRESFNELETKSLPKETVEALNKTNKVIIKNGEDTLGIIDSKEVIAQILNGLENSYRYGEFFTCDGYGYTLEMYEGDSLIDTIYYWGDTRLIPKSIHSGCAYYSVSSSILDLRKIIEENTDYKFFYLLNYSDTLASDSCPKKPESFYEDDKIGRAHV